MLVSALRAEGRFMQLNVSLRLALVVVCAGAIWGCGDSRSQLLPTSPSSLSSGSSPRTPGTIRAPGRGGSTATVMVMTTATRRCRIQTGNRCRIRARCPIPINSRRQTASWCPSNSRSISSGRLAAAAFAPNPLQAAIGNTIVWSNSDLIVHDIVLDDGTPVGILAPGQSSAPISISTPTAGYHCTLHPSMVGQVTTVPPDQPVPTDPSQIPMPDPGYAPPPSGDPYGDGYDDGYEDDYY